MAAAENTETDMGPGSLQSHVQCWAWAQRALSARAHLSTPGEAEGALTPTLVQTRFRLIGFPAPVTSDLL